MKAKMTVIASALLVGLMLIGVSYALWSKTLTINGKVETGRLDAWFTGGHWTDSLDQEGLIPVPPEKEIYTVSLHYGTLPQGGVDFEYVYIDIDHLYPCIWIHVNLTITNTGTIPLKFQYFYLYGNNVPGDVILSGDLWGLQLEPQEYTTCDVHIHLNNTAQQDQPLGTYGFYVYIEAVQWNEFDPLVGPGP